LRWWEKDELFGREGEGGGQHGLFAVCQAVRREGGTCGWISLGQRNSDQYLAKTYRKISGKESNRPKWLFYAQLPR